MSVSLTPSGAAPGATGNFEFAALRWANNYRHALLREFSPFLKGEIVEVGAGIGQFTELIGQLANATHLTAIEPDGAFCEQFRNRLPKVNLIQGTAADLPQQTACDGIVTINVLEHIREDQAELSRYAALLQKHQGVLCLFVPARQEIYAALDKDFGHYRRYGRAELRRKLETSGFRVLRLKYFNLIGYFAWGLTFRLLRKRSFNEQSVRFFDRFIFPIGYGLESRVLRPPFGQSLLAVARAGQR